MVDTLPRQQARTRRFTLGAPRNIVVTPDGRRVLFLRSNGPTDAINRLWSLDPDTGSETLMADPLVLADTEAADLPAAERARRERARESGGGIVSYALDAAGVQAVFALAGEVFVVDLAAASTQRLPTEPGAFDPRLDPTGSTVGYVVGSTFRLCSVGETDTSAGPDRLRCSPESATDSWGSAEFIAGEEMNRTRGFWWAPDGSRLAVQRTDVADVPVWNIASPISPAQAPQEIRYPAAGETNARVELHIVDVAGDGVRVAIDWNPDGEWEYLANVSWSPTNELLLVVQPRDQRTTAILSANPDTGIVAELYRWTDPAWTEIVPGAPRRVDDALLTVQDDAETDTRRIFLDGSPVSPPGLQIRAVVFTDDDGIVVTASEDPTETGVFRIQSGTADRLTTPGGIHTATAAGGTTVWSSASLDHAGSRHEVNGHPITSNADTPLLTPNLTLSKSGSRELATALLLPEDFDGTSSLPVLLDPYGGPHAQRVTQARGQYLVSQWFANQGYAVVITDNRGTPGRGPAFEREVLDDLAGPVLDDQIDALHALAAQHSFLDLDRVAIRGWSFGGYLAALAVLQRGDVFHAAIAGAPVTDWRLYDTHYTERYLGHPATNAAAYVGNDLTPLAAQLERPLLLIHGLADDNVVAAHTLQLSQALLEAGRFHTVLPLSGVTHMTPQEVVAENLLLLQRDFLAASLTA